MLPMNCHYQFCFVLLFRQTFRIPRMRTADIVKKEITDLENLLKGMLY